MRFDFGGDRRTRSVFDFPLLDDEIEDERVTLAPDGRARRGRRRFVHTFVFALCRGNGDDVFDE